jgi:hypothetical protein
MRVMRGWLISPKWELAMGAAAKCGSTSLAQLFKANAALRLNVPDARHGREDWSMVPRSYRIVGVVRHPVPRFLSLWHNVQERKRGGANNFYNQFVGHGPEALLEGIQKAGLEYEFHFQPQYLIGHEQLGAELVRLMNLNDWWVQNAPAGATGMPVENKSIGHSPDADTLAHPLAPAICQLYARDLDLWERAWSSAT